MGCGASTEKVPNISLDFEKATEPHSEEERQIFEMIAPVLEKSPQSIELLQGYTGCEDPIRKALGEPSPEHDKVAWTSVRDNVDIIYKFYKHSQEIEKVFPKLLVVLCDGDVQTLISQNQALVRQYAELLSFGFHFDEIKMVKPALQNDFSYYRRVLTRMRAAQRNGTNNDEETKKKNKGMPKKKDLKVDEELANKISLFFAYPTPMMKVIIDTTTAYEGGKYNDSLITGLSLIANLCYGKLNVGNLEKEQQMLFLCAMTGSIILIDHLHPQGAFHKKSPIMIKGCITLLKDTNTQQPTDFLLNSLRFTTIHLNEPQSMPAIQKILA